jgi:CheY-like chemotaxis protein
LPQQAAAAADPQSARPRHVPKIRVLIADDHAVVAQGIRELLRDKFDFVGIVHNGQALIEAVDELSISPCP